ncbi:hypothetical protein [Aliihoeflea sp. 40Bstr573]|uniref:hypothetical protein n=1 Tax=Aliihoeflea sp. 40Bstr573 TaxID=2696467 RepID=UPI00209460C0|nr:hypothetical protein [Aliihoeflea sp. 40Bstr573]
MADPLRNRDPGAHDPVNPADPADPNYVANDPRAVDPATGAARPSDTIVVDNTGRSGGGSNALVLGVVAAAIVVALLVFMNWSPGTDTPVDPGGAIVEEPAATAPAPAGDTAAPAPAAEEPADAAPAAPAAEDTAPASTETAPAPAPAE